MAASDDVVIISACRTPVGKFQGSLSDLSAPQLGAIVVREAVLRAKLDPKQVDECIMGNVVSAGLGQNPARQAAIFGGLPPEVGAMTVNKVCGSGLKAVAATKECRLKAQIVPVELPARKKGAAPIIFDKDESPREDTTIEILRSLKPAFKKDGTVTAGNAPGVNDGAAAVVVTSAKRAQELGAQPMVRIVAQATSGIDPKWVMMAPVSAVRKIWEKTGWKNEDVDLYELNEAFSAQALAVMRELGLDPNKVNVNGGAVAIGHPIGASGARVLVTLIYEMIRRNVHRGVATLCLGGGNAVAMAVER